MLYKIVVVLTCLLLVYFQAVIKSEKEHLPSMIYSCIYGSGILQVVDNSWFSVCDSELVFPCDLKSRRAGVIDMCGLSIVNYLDLNFSAQCPTSASSPDCEVYV